MESSNRLTRNGQQRIVIEGVSPEIDGGRFAIKRCLHDKVIVKASIFADGHDELGAELKYREENSEHWHSVTFLPLGNDEWQAAFTVNSIGRYRYTISAWIDYFHSWRRNFARWVEAKQDIKEELLVAIQLINNTIHRASKEDAEQLKIFAHALQSHNDQEKVIQQAMHEELFQLMTRYPDVQNACHYEKELTVIVEREQARFSAWYEVFPRSLGRDGQHGSFKDLITHLPYIAEMGFDVLYMPPIHPIGDAFRKGHNNRIYAEPGEPGSPWGIGSNAGGHVAIHPELGTLKDFQALVAAAKELNLEIALDIALQCSPDHPYVKEHSEWFKKRPNGSIQYAENPPKKYQDIYPIYFQNEEWFGLWRECKAMLLFWIKQGVRIFRVDNPHTKPFIFWEWLISEIKQEFPDTIFLAEAFTRPKLMYYLAKLGYSQSYTYFTWRNTKAELTEYFTELTQAPLREYFRANLWPNTPDILHEFLQTGGHPAFMIRLILASMLGANYGIYGPAYELCVNTPREPGSEEYLDSEKYQITEWNLSQKDSLKDLITKINTIRKNHLCLQQDWNLQFHDIDNEQLICFSKSVADKSETIVVVVNLDPHHKHFGWLTLPLENLKINPQESYSMHDLLDGNIYLWNGPRNYIELNPKNIPAHIFLVQRIHHEQDFEYF